MSEFRFGGLPKPSPADAISEDISSATFLFSIDDTPGDSIFDKTNQLRTSELTFCLRRYPLARILTTGSRSPQLAID